MTDSKRTLLNTVVSAIHDKRAKTARGNEFYLEMNKNTQDALLDELYPIECSSNFYSRNYAKQCMESGIYTVYGVLVSTNNDLKDDIILTVER